MLMPIIKVDTTIGEQLDKVFEEVNEIAAAIEEGESVERVLEECMDTHQALNVLMGKIGVKKEIVDAIWAHHVKMFERGHDMEPESIIFEIK